MEGVETWNGGKSVGIEGQSQGGERNRERKGGCWVGGQIVADPADTASGKDRRSVTEEQETGKKTVDIPQS